MVTPRAVFLVLLFGLLLQTSHCTADEPSCDAAAALAQNELKVATRFHPPENTVHDGAASVPGCLVLREQWWSYELCVGRWIRQFHEEKGVVLAEFFLGRAQHAFTNDFIGKYRVKYADGLRSIRQQLEAANLDGAVRQHYSCRPSADGADVSVVDTMYNSGTVCELTKQPRVSHVVFVCAQEAFPITFNVTETKTCVYTIYVAGAAVCDMMSIAAPAPSQSTPAASAPLKEEHVVIPASVQIPEELLLFAL